MRGETIDLRRRRGYSGMDEIVQVWGLSGTISVQLWSFVQVTAYKYDWSALRDAGARRSLSVR